MANIDKKEEIRQLKKQLKQALRKIEKLQSENKSLKTNNNICSDIIESAFGYFKERISPNKNNGYTPLVLLIPLRLRLSTIEDCKKFNARTAIGKTKMEDIKKWRADNLLPNPSIKRMNVLKKVS